MELSLLSVELSMFINGVVSFEKGFLLKHIMEGAWLINLMSMETLHTFSYHRV